MSEEKRTAWWDPALIDRQYRDGIAFKNGLGDRGAYEQGRMNERFYVGDQWHGAQCGKDRPLLMHNVIKRIGGKPEIKQHLENLGFVVRRRA